MAGMYGCFKGRNSDSAAMASGPPDLMTNQEPSEVQEECSGKKKSKFQTFKKFFARKKRKEPQTAEAEAGLKVSQSSDNVSKTPENNTLTRSEKGSGSKVSLGGKALSHDSVFVSDSSETNEALGASQDSIHGKVKTLQLQLKQAIRLGSPPSLICVKKTEDGGTTSEDDGLPCSPPEYTNHRSVTNQAQRNSSNSLQAIDSDDDKLSCAASSRAMSPLVAPGDFGQPASPFSCLDNSAAKHKLGLRHKACNKRKPASRLELRAEGEESTISSPGAETETERAEDESGDDLKPKLDREEEEEEEEEEVEEDEEEEEKGQEQDSTVSLLRDEGEEDDVEAEQEVSHAPDESCPSEMSLSEEEASDGQLLSSTKLSSRSSSPITPRASPEPPAGPKEHPVSPAGSSPCEAEDLHADGDSVSEGEDVLQTHVEEESSFLEEVLSSLKTPLASHSPDAETEGDVLEIKGERKEREEGVVETEGVETEGVETDEEVVIKDEEADGYQAASSCAALSDQTNEEEEEEVPDYTLQEEGVEVGEEVEGSEEEVDFEEEDVAVEQFTQHEDEEDMQEEEAEEVKPEEEHDTLTRQSTSQEGEEEEAEEDEREDEATDMEEKPEGEEEVKEESEAGYGEEEAEERGKVEDEEEEEKGDAEELTERIPDFQAEELEMTSPVQEEDEGVVEDDDDDDDQNTKYTDDEIPIEMGGQALARGHEGRDDRDQSSRDESKDEEEAGLIEQEEEDEGQPDQTGEDLELESDETESHFNMKQNESSDAAGQTPALSRPHPLAPPESHPDTPSDEGAVSPTSKAAFLHINLVSPSAEKATSLFQLHPAAEDPRERVTESPPSALESSDLNADEEQAGSLEDQEPKQSTVHHHHHHHDASVRSPEQEAPTQPTDQSKVRFTVAPAWQRSQSLGSSPPLTGCVSPSSPVSEPRGDEKDHDTRAESTKTPHSSGAERTSESSVIVEGNPENPFGVRLRKTSALRRFSSEEETTELPAESPAPTACSKVDSPQPVGDKTSACLPNNKPTLPKKPDIHGEAGAKLRRISEPAPGRGPSGGSDPPSWISMAKQKQKVYKENSQDEFTATKEEQEIKPSLPISVSSAASRKPSNKTHECTSKEGHSEISKPSVFAEKEIRRFFSPPTPVPPQPLKSQLLPSPVAPKPQVLPPTPKHPAQTSSSQIPLSPPTPVPVPSKSPSCSTPSHLSKPATAAQTPAVTSPPFSTRTTPDKSGFRAPGLPRQAVSPQRDLPSPALPQDEPPWMALAKKKAKAWSEMPQIVQ